MGWTPPPKFYFFVVESKPVKLFNLSLQLETLLRVLDRGIHCVSFNMLVVHRKIYGFELLLPTSVGDGNHAH